MIKFLFNFKSGRIDSVVNRRTMLILIEDEWLGYYQCHFQHYFSWHSFELCAVFLLCYLPSDQGICTGLLRFDEYDFEKCIMMYRRVCCCCVLFFIFFYYK